MIASTLTAKPGAIDSLINVLFFTFRIFRIQASPLVHIDIHCQYFLQMHSLYTVLTRFYLISPLMHRLMRHKDSVLNLIVKTHGLVTFSKRCNTLS